MEYDVLRYFAIKKINPGDIIYLVRKNPHTVINLFDGREISTMIPLKEILSELPTDDFLTITKGVALRKEQIVNISDEGVYTMTDDRTFQGRKRNLSQHKKIRKELNLTVALQKSNYTPPMGLLEKCSLMDAMPLAFCVIELVFDANGHGVDFVFRYCNQEMEAVEGFPVEQMLNRSFYEVFQNGDKKWLLIYADVALNGTRRNFRDYSPEINKKLTIHCYQPAPGHCACVLIPD